MIYLQLIFEFFKTGLFAVGGGLATIPFLREMGEKYGWFSGAELTDMIAVSESTPGPIGINMATYVGFETTGIFGAIISTLSLVFPSVIIMCIISKFLKKFRQNKVVQGAFYGIRPVSVALIVGSMATVIASSLFNFAMFQTSGDFLASINFFATGLFLILTAVCIVLPKVHPIFIIAAGAAAGIFFGQYLG